MASAILNSTSVVASKAGFAGNVKSLNSSKNVAARPQACKVVRMSAASGEVPDMTKRNLMNLALVGAVGLPGLSLAGGYALFFVPPRAAGGGGGIAAKDAAGNDIKESQWLATHQAGARELTQGLKGDATYLVVLDDGTLADYGVNAVCTHLGCVVPWNKVRNY